ncbi:MAG: Nif3-like dinuclear metal center hexameric protein [Clostridiales bacterium]|nr:Nif3-like dinuclear metal center hexameric protein [Clostridiales bacterium]
MQGKLTTVQTVLDWLDQAAPFETQEEFDNAGLQVGQLDSPVTNILLTLDVTEDAIKEAAGLGAELIISHHPLIFSPITALDLSHYVPKLIALLIKHNISLISTHTNIDQSMEYSASAAVANKIGLKNIRKVDSYLFLGELEEPLKPESLAQVISETLNVPVRQYGQIEGMITSLAIAGGAYSEGFMTAKKSGAQALLTGEVKHHHALEAASDGIILFDGGHYATEFAMLEPLAFGLQTALNQVEYPVQVHVTGCVSYQLQ